MGTTPRGVSEGAEGNCGGDNKPFSENWRRSIRLQFERLAKDFECVPFISVLTGLLPRQIRLVLYISMFRSLYLHRSVYYM